MFYDRGDCVADYNANEDLQRYYITPFMDENMVLTDASSGTPSMDFFYAQDGLGTVRQIFDDTSSLVNNYDYEGFGTETSTTGALYNRYRYTGREYDAETEWNVSVGAMNYSFNGTYYYRARTYDTTIGSFTSRDPIPANNLYPYCAANPINFTDPDGKWRLYSGLSKEEEEEWERDLDLRTDEEKRDFRTWPNSATKINNCKCATDYVKCLLGKVIQATSDLKKALTNAIAANDKGKNPAKLDSKLIEYLNAQYSFFDTDPVTGYEGAKSYDYKNGWHFLQLKSIGDRIKKMSSELAFSSIRIDCENFSYGEDKSAGKISNDGTYIRLNTKYFCYLKSNFKKAKYYSGSDEHFNGHTIAHELTHLTFGSKDFNKTYYGENTLYPDLDLQSRVEHAETHALLIMRYFPDIPECKFNKIECCSELGEDLYTR